MLNIKDTDDLISRLENIFKNKKYSYKKVIYTKDTLPVTIGCPIHGDFYESPYNLITNQVGCPLCQANHSKGELAVKEILDEYGIVYETEKSMPFLKYKENLRFDFWLPELKVAIEYQGSQHFQPIDFFGGNKSFQEQKARDNVKREFCKFYNYELIEINFYEDPFEKLKPIIDEHFIGLY